MAHFSDRYPFIFYSKTLAQRVRELCDKLLSEIGINYSLGMLLGQINCFQESGIDITRKELERALKLSGPSVSNLLNRLEDMGAIKKTTSTVDSRFIGVEITDGGRGLLDGINSVFFEVNSACLTGMTEDQKDSLLKLLKQALRNAEVCLGKSAEE